MVRHRWPGIEPGVGPVVTTELTLAIDEFKAIGDPKKAGLPRGCSPL